MQMKYLRLIIYYSCLEVAWKFGKIYKCTEILIRYEISLSLNIFNEYDKTLSCSSNIYYYAK